MTTKPRKIVITVPHGYCLYRPTRTCDLRALSAANILYEALVKLAKSPEEYPILFPAVIERQAHDLNRPWSRETEWRKYVHNMLCDLSKDYELILVDMHSFVTIINPKYKKYDFTKHKMALLDFSENIINVAIVNLMNKALEETNVLGETDAVLVPGSEVNDIMLTSRKYAIYSFLIEVNENHEKLTDVELYKCFSDLAAFLITYDFATNAKDIKLPLDKSELCSIM